MEESGPRTTALYSTSKTQNFYVTKSWFLVYLQGSERHLSLSQSLRIIFRVLDILKTTKSRLSDIELNCCGDIAQIFIIQKLQGRKGQLFIVHFIFFQKISSEFFSPDLEL